MYPVLCSTFLVLRSLYSQTFPLFSCTMSSLYSTSTLHSCTVQYITILYSTSQYCTVQLITLLYSAHIAEQCRAQDSETTLVHYSMYNTVNCTVYCVLQCVLCIRRQCSNITGLGTWIPVQGICTPVKGRVPLHIDRERFLYMCTGL